MMLFKKAEVSQLALALSVAINKENVGEIKNLVLRSNNAEFDINTLIGGKPLIYCAAETHDCVVMQEILKAKNLDIDAVTFFQKKKKEKEEFIEGGMPLCDQRTALHYAALNGLDDMVQILLEHKAEPNCVDAKNMTPVLLAIYQGHIHAIIKLVPRKAKLIHCADPNLQPLFVAWNQYLISNEQNKKAAYKTIILNLLFWGVGFFRPVPTALLKTDINFSYVFFGESLMNDGMIWYRRIDYDRLENAFFSPDDVRKFEYKQRTQGEQEIVQLPYVQFMLRCDELLALQNDPRVAALKKNLLFIQGNLKNPQNLKGRFEYVVDADDVIPVDWRSRQRALKSRASQLENLFFAVRHGYRRPRKCANGAFKLGLVLLAIFLISFIVMLAYGSSTGWRCFKQLLSSAVKNSDKDTSSSALCISTASISGVTLVGGIITLIISRCRLRRDGEVTDDMFAALQQLKQIIETEDLQRTADNQLTLLPQVPGNLGVDTSSKMVMSQLTFLKNYYDGRQQSYQRSHPTDFRPRSQCNSENFWPREEEMMVLDSVEQHETDALLGGLDITNI